MIEDRAITGRISNKWKKDNAGADLDALEDALASTIREIFRLQTEIVSEHYSGDDFGNSLIIRLTYRAKDGPDFYGYGRESGTADCKCHAEYAVNKDG